MCHIPLVYFSIPPIVAEISWKTQYGLDCYRARNHLVLHNLFHWKSLLFQIPSRYWPFLRLFSLHFRLNSCNFNQRDCQTARNQGRSQISKTRTTRVRNEIRYKLAILIIYTRNKSLFIISTSITSLFKSATFEILFNLEGFF